MNTNRSMAWLREAVGGIKYPPTAPGTAGAWQETVQATLSHPGHPPVPSSSSAR